MIASVITELDEEIERLTQVRLLLADGAPFHTARAKKPHGLSLVKGGKAGKASKVDRRRGKRSPAVLAHMREAQRKRWSHA